MVNNPQEISVKLNCAVKSSIKKTINKFREQPYFFFTESDIHSYFYHSLYCSSFKITKDKDKKEIYLVHREYPTNFRYNKKTMLERDNPFNACENEGSRGHYDVAILNPVFVSQDMVKIEDIVNKNVSDAAKRMKGYELANSVVKEELTFAIEFKYVIKNTANFVDEVKRDNKKLEWAKNHGVKEPVNLVFCNIPNVGYVKDIEKLILNYDKEVAVIFAHSYYSDNKKVTPRPILSRYAKKLFPSI